MKTFNDCIILFGGVSEERLVSVASAQNLSKNIPEALLWFISPRGSIFPVSFDDLKNHEDVFTKEFKPTTLPLFDSLADAVTSLKNKIVIMGLHGTEGEDGKIQKLFEENGISFTGSGSTASALAFDKLKTKQIAKANGIPVCEELAIYAFNESEVKSLNQFFQTYKKMVLKPLANGSSVGLFIINSQKDLDDAVSTIHSRGIYSYLAEPFIEGREITVGVWQKTPNETVPMPCSEVRVIQGRQFDYEGKYLGKGVEELTPAPLEPQQFKECQQMALKLHLLVGCKGYTRTDMILTEKGPMVLEINTLPGLSKASFVPQQLAVMGVSLRTFFESQINA